MRRDTLEKINTMREKAQGESEEYKAFVEKFIPKKTTDDCYTPANVYEAVSDFVSKTYGKDKTDFVRPFYPGSDYITFDYPSGCVVVDNPPFSILTKIVKWYQDKGIEFFLFAPALTCFNPGRFCNVISVGVDVVYENGAKVNTSFLTNIGNIKIMSSPELYKAVYTANKQSVQTRKLPKYKYPPEVLTASKLNTLSLWGVNFQIERAKSGGDPIHFIRSLENQGKTKIFGGGFLISSEKAAELKAAELKAAELKTAELYHSWSLSEEEKEIVKSLDI